MQKAKNIWIIFYEIGFDKLPTTPEIDPTNNQKLIGAIKKITQKLQSIKGVQNIVDDAIFVRLAADYEKAAQELRKEQYAKMKKSN